MNQKKQKVENRDMQNRKMWIAVVMSIQLSVFPLLFFYNVLYYNEILSTSFVILMYLSGMLKFYFVSSIVCFYLSCYNMIK